jgi:BASS family bile acid:Na+ symporter
MNFSKFRQQLKPWMLPISMLGGVLFHEQIDAIAFLAPYLIFIMLLITFCKIKASEFKVTSLSRILLTVQLFGSLICYAALKPFSEDVAQAAFMCVFCPTATAAPVITGMLGGSVPRLATFSIVSNIAVAILAPSLFTLLGGSSDLSFINSTLLISVKVMPLIIAPLLLAFFLEWACPRAHQEIAQRQSWSFYIWAVSLFIVVGRAISFILKEPASRIPEMIVIALASLVVCCLQFYIGRRIGRHCGDKIAGAQGLGQKNTVLAIWMSLTFLNPISAVGPAAYVAWQNTINSLQLYFKARKGEI